MHEETPSDRATLRIQRRPGQHHLGADNAIVTLGLALFALVLLTAVVLLAGNVLSALAMLDASLIVFLVAFATAPLFTRLPVAWPTRGSVLGMAAGWLLAAPLDAMIRGGLHALEGSADPDGFFPRTWLWALPSLVIVLVVAAVREWHTKCRRRPG